jgi:integrase
LQRFLEAKAPTLSFSMVHHLRWDQRAIFGLALSEAAITHDPTGRLYTPTCRPAAPCRKLTLTQVRKILDALQLRERIAARLALLEGMRPGEILALRWRNFETNSFQVESRLYRKELDTPKTRKSKREGGLTFGTIEDLATWRTMVRDPSPDAFIFATATGAPRTRTCGAGTCFRN